MSGLVHAQSDAGIHLNLRDLLIMTTSMLTSVHAQQSLVAAAQESVRGARWQYFPTFSFSVQSAQSGSADMAYAGDSRDTILALTQPLWTGGRIEAGVEKAQFYSAGAHAALAEAQQQLAIRVVQACGELQTAYRKRIAFEVSLGKHTGLKDQVVRRIHEGQAAASDLALAQSRLAGLEPELAAAITQEEVGLARLSQLLGRPILASHLTAALAQPLQNNTKVGELLTQAMSYSPALGRARSIALSQQATIQEVKSATQPEASFRLEQQSGNFN